MSPSPAPQAQPSFIERLKNLLMARGALGKAGEQGAPPTPAPPSPQGDMTAYQQMLRQADEANKRSEIPAHAMGAVAGVPPGGPGAMGNYGTPSPMGQNIGPRMAPPQGGQLSPMETQGLRYGGAPSAPPQPPPPVPGGTAPVLNTGGGQPLQAPQPHSPMPIGGQQPIGKPPMGSYGAAPVPTPVGQPLGQHPMGQIPPKPSMYGNYPNAQGH